MSRNLRPSEPISRSLSGGPTACDARLALSMRIVTADRLPLDEAMSTRAA